MDNAGDAIDAIGDKIVAAVVGEKPEVYGAGRSNLFIGGIRQQSIDPYADENTPHRQFADNNNAVYIPTYYSGGPISSNEVDEGTKVAFDAGDVNNAANGIANYKNGLANDELKGHHYDSIIAYSGGTATAVTAIAKQGVTCDTLILISPMKGTLGDDVYKKEITDILDKGYVKNIVVIWSPKDTPTTKYAAFYEVGQKTFDDDTRIRAYKAPLEKSGIDAHKEIFYDYAIKNIKDGVYTDPQAQPSETTLASEDSYEPVEVEVKKVATAETSSKVPSAEWSKTFGGTGNDQAYSVHTTSDGGYIFAGETGSIGAGGQDAWLVKTDSQGNEIWSRTFGGTNDDVAYSIQLTPDEGYIIAGTTKSFGAGGQDAWLVKTDSQGNEIWSRTFGGWNDDSAYSIQLTSDGGYIVAGDTKSFSAQGRDALQYLQANGLPQIPPASVNPRDSRYFIDCDTWLIKTDANGNEIWNKTLGKETIEGIYSGYDDSAYSVQPTSDGGYILAGGTPFGETRLIKTNDKGNEIWYKTFTGPGSEAHSVYPTSDGGYIIAGRGSRTYNAWLIKTDAVGNELWNKTFGGAGYSVFQVQPTSDGGYILAGSTELIKADVNGNELWNETFDEGPDEGVSSICPTSDGGYILAGLTASNSENWWDAGLIKIAST